MEQNRTIKINPALAIIVIIQIIFVIFVGITIHRIFNKEEETAKIGIDNYPVIFENENNQPESFTGISAGADLSDSQKSVIEGVLYDMVLLNNPNHEISSVNNANIRVGSVYDVYINDLNLYVLNFIIDIKDLEQSYRIVYRWSDNYPNKSIPPNNPAIAFCLDDDELIYGNFNCRDRYNNHGKDLIVHGLLRYKEFSNFTIGLSGNVFSGEALSLRINTISDEESVKDAAVSQVSEYLFGLGFSLGDFEYTVGSYVCCSLD